MTWSYWVGAGGSLPIILFGPVACGRISRIDAAGKETNDHRHAGSKTHIAVPELWWRDGPRQRSVQRPRTVALGR